MGSVPLDRSWTAASWQGARDDTRRIGESMTLEEKLEWLEATQMLAEELSRGGSGADQGPAAPSLETSDDSESVAAASPRGHL